MHQGRRARELREEREWTQNEVKRRLGKEAERTLSRPAISLIEQREWLDGELIQDLATVFGVSPMVFFDQPSQQRGETREEVIDRVFSFVLQDPTVELGGRRMKKWPCDAKLAIIRLYERCTGTKLVPSGIA